MTQWNDHYDTSKTNKNRPINANFHVINDWFNVWYELMLIGLQS